MLGNSKYMFNKKSFTALTIGLLLLSVVMFYAGCTERLKGDVNGNQVPIVYFVNIPPENQTFSRNPVVYWYATDVDGQIDYFRYHTALASEVLAAGSPTDYLNTLPEEEMVINCYDSVDGGNTIEVCDTTYVSVWTTLDVVHDPTQQTTPDPHTTNIIEMSADISNPVNNYVAQYIFVQAFDEEGGASDVVWRSFSRNDNPPQTQILGITIDSPFVNSVIPGGAITGVKIKWQASDPIDYPSDPPPFEYEWKLFGPYTEAEFTEINDSFLTQVYVTADARVFEIGEMIEICDTFFVADSIEVQCDTIVVEDTTSTTAFGGLEPLFWTSADGFIDKGYYRIADSSGDGIDVWVDNAADTIFDVYTKYYEEVAGDDPALSDTTNEMYFIFTVRSRDDAKVADLTPAYKTFTVIDPRQEREVMVIDVTKELLGNRSYTRYVNSNVAKAFWYNTLITWKNHHPELFGDMADEEFFDTTTITLAPGPFRNQARDYLRTQFIDPRLTELLKHKVLIIYHDDIRDPLFMDQADAIFTAIDAGINVWVMMRAPLYGGLGVCENFQVPVPFDYMRYFGVTGMVYSGWHGNLAQQACAAYFKSDNSDFIGAYSIDSTTWPNIMLDSALLHERYIWQPVEPGEWIPEKPVLPEVDWSIRGFGTQIMYLYRSFYGAAHPLGADFNFEGTPVGHRYQVEYGGGGGFRTVHFNFTPLAIPEEQMDPLTLEVLDWLYPQDGTSMSAGVSGNFRPDTYDQTPVRVSKEDVAENFRRRREEWAARKGIDLTEGEAK